MNLGHSELLERDEGTGMAGGAFVPAPDYFRVQTIFRLFVESNAESAEPTDEDKLARYYAARDELGLRLVDPRGRTIGTDAIHIADYSVEAGPEALEIEVTIIDPEFWRMPDAS